MIDFPNDARASDELKARFDAAGGLSLKIGAAGLAVSLAGALAFPSAFFPAYLAALLFWVGVSVASLGLCLLFHLAGGSWMVPLRRPFEAAGWQVGLLAVFFLPVLAGLGHTYAWTDPAVVDSMESVAYKVREIGYLTPANFTIRAAIYFAIWGAVAFMVCGWSREQDETAGDAPSRRLWALAGPATLVMFLSVSAAAFDWGMSRDPDWYSTIYGALYIIGSILAALSLAAIFIVRHQAYEPFKTAQNVGRLNDLGNLMLTFTMLWAYFAFSQFLIIWLGNLPEEVIFYQRRIQGLWGAVGLALIAFGFFAPFLALLQKKHKRDVAWITPIAVGILVMRLVDSAWNVLPGFAKLGSEWDGFPWVGVGFYVAALAGIGGIWHAMFLKRLTTARLVPLRDPTVIAAVEFDLAHEPAGDLVP